MSTNYNSRKPLGIAAMWGSGVFAAITAVGITCFYLFAHGTGESSPGMLFAFARGFIGLPSYLVLHIIGKEESFHSYLAYDCLNLAVNALLGAFVFTIARFVWDIVKQRT